MQQTLVPRGVYRTSACRWLGLRGFTSNASCSLPLKGVKVLEFSHAVMGPSAGLILADLGASVTKVEPPQGGDRTRHLQGVGVSFWPLLSRNKRSIALDLKSAASRPAIDALLAETDVLIENFAFGTMAKLGLGYEELALRFPRLVYVECKGFSRQGPYAKRSALDEVVQMMSGLAYMTGPPGKPLRAGASVVDLVGGMYAAIGTLAALHERETTGLGQLVSSSLFEAAAFLVGQHMVQHGITGENLVPMSVPNRAWGVYDIFHSAEGKAIFVGVVSEGQWTAFTREFNLPDLASDKRLQTNNDRMAMREWLVPELAKVFEQLPTEVLLRRCEDAGLAFGPVNSPEDLLEDSHLNYSGALKTVDVAGKSVRVPRLPIELAGRQFSVRTPPPALGEHSVAELRGAGLSQSTVDELIRAGLVSTCNQDTF